VQLPTVTRNFPSLAQSYGRVLATQAAREDAGDADAPVSTLEWPPPLVALEQPAYCIACDAPRGECDHIVGHYLEPLVYTQLEGTDPKSFRWARGADEKWRTDNPQDTWPKAAPLERVEAATPLPELLAALERRMELGNNLEDLVREAYANDPLKTSRACTRLLDDAERQQFRSPGGILFSRLKHLRSK
jgi:hypothetical protein